MMADFERACTTSDLPLVRKVPVGRLNLSPFTESSTTSSAGTGAEDDAQPGGGNEGADRRDT